MFKISYLILHFFQLVLRILSNLALDIVYKDSRLSKAFFQEDFKLVVGQQSYIVTFDPIFLQLTIKKIFSFKKEAAKSIYLQFLTLAILNNLHTINKSSNTLCVNFHSINWAFQPLKTCQKLFFQLLQILKIEPGC